MTQKKTHSETKRGKYMKHWKRTREGEPLILLPDHLQKPPIEIDWDHLPDGASEKFLKRMFEYDDLLDDFPDDEEE